MSRSMEVNLHHLRAGYIHLIETLIWGTFHITQICPLFVPLTLVTGNLLLDGFRYIELMRTGDNLDYFNKYHVSSKIFKDYLNKNNWIYQTLGKDAGPSLNYINPEYKGKFGIIAPYSKDFCKSCNRLRITSRGDLRLCLFGNTGISIRHLLQKNDQIEELQDLILGQMKFKKESHYLELGETGLTKNLSTTGG